MTWPHESLITRLVAAVPDWTEAYECHLLNFAELLPVHFLEEVRLTTVAAFLGAPDEPDWRRTLAFFEEQYALGDQDLRDFIFWWIIYPLPLPGKPGHGLVAHLGPAMTARWRALMTEHGLL